jgi:hypothetical protein
MAGGCGCAGYDEGVIWTALLCVMLQQAAPVPAPAPEARPAAAEAKVAAQNPPPPAPAPAPAMDGGDELLQIKTVYILHMSRAFDQYLATHLTRGGLLQVVTDPQKADAVVTEQLGRNFEDQMEELYPKPKAPDPLPSAAEAEVAEGAPPMLDMKDPEGRPRSTFGRGRGTIFIVHRASGNVVWSTYFRPKSPTADVLNDAARQVAEQIRDTIKKRQNLILKQAGGGK